jgi:hypothetical protein
MRLPTALGATAALTAALVLIPGCNPDPWWTDPNATWITTYGGDRSDVGGDLLLADDGGCFIVGTSDLRFGPEPQGDLYLIRTDGARRVLWEKRYGGEGLDMGGSIISASDGTLVIAGWSSSPGRKGKDAYLAKVDRDGNKLWSTTLEGPLDEMVSEVLETTDGGYLLVGDFVDPADTVSDPSAAGYGGHDGRSSIYLARTDADGNEIWTRVHDNGTNMLASSGVRMPDGGFLVLATVTRFPDTDDDIYLLRVDEDGNEVWAREWKEGRRAGRKLIATADGNYLIAGSHSASAAADRSEADFLFIKIDPEGREIWTSTFGDSGMIDYADVVTETKDGCYVAAGNRSKSFFTRSQDLVLVKVDESGEPIWERTFETATHNMLGAVLQHSDGGYVIAGSTIMGDDAFDVFLIKTDSEGNAEG